MGYRLGVDLGTTFTAAVVHRPGSTPTVVPLGDRSAMMPSVLFLGADGTVLVGEAAERRALLEPDRVVRGFKRRIGDETPLLVGAGGDGLTAHAIAARLIALVADRAAEQEGGAPDAIAVTVPASWGAHKKELLAAALGREGLLGVGLVSEPTAAALAYAAAGRLGAGTTVAVYDFGGGTFDAAVLRAESGSRFTPLGAPSGLADLGGMDLDDAVLAYVLGTAGPQTPGVDPDDAQLRTAMARLRRECVEAKEALSADTAATVPVLLGGAQTSVRITRGEFEAMIAGAVEETCTALEAALVSAGLTRNNLDRILLVGGSSRIPLVTQLLSARYPGVALERDIDPKLAVAIGGVLALDVGRPQAAAAIVPAQTQAQAVAAAVAPAAVVAALGTTGSAAETVDESAEPAGRHAAPRRAAETDLVAAVFGAAVTERATGSVTPERPAKEAEGFAAEGTARERRREVVPQQRKTPMVLMVAAGVIMLGGFGLSQFGSIEFHNRLPGGILQQAKAGTPHEGSAQLETEAVEDTNAKAGSSKAAGESGSTSGSAGSSASSGSADSSASAGSAGSASGRSEGSADTRATDTGASDASTADSASGSSSPVTKDQAAADRKAARPGKVKSGAGSKAAAPVTQPAAGTMSEAPAQVESPAAQDTSTDSGSIEAFNDGSAGLEPASPPSGH